MKRVVVKILALLFVAVLVVAAYVTTQSYQEKRNLLDKLLTVEKELTETKSSLLGYTKFTDYVNESKKAIEGQMKFLAAKVDREYTQVEHIQKSTIGWKSDATVILKYSVEYSFGFDLKPDSFSLSADKDGITVTLSKPDLVASPSVQKISHEIPSTGVFIDEKAAVIELQQQLPAIAKKRAIDIRNDEAVIALCEKKLSEFLRDFLSRQPNIGVVPVIKFSYK